MADSWSAASLSAASLVVYSASFLPYSSAEAPAEPDCLRTRYTGRAA